MYDHAKDAITIYINSNMLEVSGCGPNFFLQAASPLANNACIGGCSGRAV